MYLQVEQNDATVKCLLMLQCVIVLKLAIFAVLVNLYEEPEKPNNALEYVIILS